MIIKQKNLTMRLSQEVSSVFSYFTSLGVPMETLEELLEVHSTAGDVPPADGAVVRVQPGPAVSTHEVSPNTLEHVELPGELDITDLEQRVRKRNKARRDLPDTERTSPQCSPDPDPRASS